MELILDIVISAVSITVIAQYTWAGKGHFSSDKLPLGAMLISLVVLTTGLFFLYLTWTGEQPLGAQVTGLALQLFSWWLFWRAISASREAKLRLAFDEEGPRGLVTVGPYRMVRHPFYTSYLIFWAGWALALWTPVALLPLVIIVTIYTFAAVIEERKFAATHMAADYAEYRKATGFFWPRLGGRF